jgi:hypothetical protein
MNRSQLVFGIVFVTVGGLLLADQAGLADTWAVLAAWWPIVVLLSGAAQLLLRPRNVIGGLTVLAIGGVLLLFTHGLVETLSLLWPLLLIGCGAWLLVGRVRTRHVDGHEVTDVVAVLDERHVHVSSGPYPGGAVTTVFGDVHLDLSEVSTTDDPGILQVTTVFGDVEITLPAGWGVEVSGPELFGDVRVPHPATPPDDGARPRVLRLRTLLVFGDVTVHTTRREVPVASSG